MDKPIARIQTVLNRVPGPSKLLFGNLTADRQSFRALSACLLAILCTYLAPPVISLGSPPIEQGLRAIGSGTGINAAAGQSGYTLGVIVSSLLVTVLADSAFHAQMRQANLSSATMAQIDSVWENTFARAMSGNYTRLPTEAAQWVTMQFAPAFTAGLAGTLLIMAVVVLAVAIFIFVAMERGLKGSLMQTTAGIGSGGATG